MVGLLALHAAAGLVAIALGQRLGRRAFGLALVPLVATIGWLVARSGAIVDGDVPTESFEWVPSLGIAVDVRMDGFAALMSWIIAGVGVAVVLYAVRYFGEGTPDVGRLAGLLTLFAGAMLGVAVADDLLLLYTCWELTSITSYLLIGNKHTDAKARAAALHALLVTSAGGLAMLGGFVLLGQAAGTFRLSEILADPPSGTKVTAGLALVLLGVFTKSAQYPFHSWLPGAMAAPTPVSAYLHSATMVKAGVYLLARLAPAFATVGFWRPVVLGIGLLTMVGGGLRALRQHDLKLLLAYGTVSQLGFLVVMFGAGVPGATEAGCVLLLAHALFKAPLFMVVGILDVRLGTRDLRELPVLGREWRAVAAVTVVSCASMAGAGPLAGFVAKEAGYEALYEASFASAKVVLASVVVASALTVAYSIRFAWGVLVAPRRDGRQACPATAVPGAWFAAPPVALAGASLLLGVAPALADPLVNGAVQSLDSRAEPVHLALWHGFNVPLGLSLLTVAIGVAVFVARRPVSRVLAAGERIPSSSDAYLATLRGLNVVADRVTGVVQNGSLPVYAGVILLTAAALPGITLVREVAWPGWPEVAVEPALVPVLAVLLGGAIAAATFRRRLSAVLFLGVVGYGMAGLFLVQGAPDLALTQVAIETLSTVLFVLVFRHFPGRFEPRSTPRRRAVRLTISLVVAVTVFAFAVVVGQQPASDEVSAEMVERAYPDGDGRNVVNVILVDFRGFDTLGEITVLAAAAIGMVALARAGRRAPRSQRRAEAST
jgi:multicomponent Na+:H+ antiporter subunit A